MFCVDGWLLAKRGNTFKRLKWSLHTLNLCLCHNLLHILSREIMVVYHSTRSHTSTLFTITNSTRSNAKDAKRRRKVIRWRNGEFPVKILNNNDLDCVLVLWLPLLSNVCRSALYALKWYVWFFSYVFLFFCLLVLYSKGIQHIDVCVKRYGLSRFAYRNNFLYTLLQRSTALAVAV